MAAVFLSTTIFSLHFAQPITTTIMIVVIGLVLSCKDSFQFLLSWSRCRRRLCCFLLTSLAALSTATFLISILVLVLVLMLVLFGLTLTLTALLGAALATAVTLTALATLISLAAALTTTLATTTTSATFGESTGRSCYSESYE